MPFPPNLFLIGAQKAGTTFLATLLGQHSQICLAEPKEPHYYTQHWDKGYDWYRGFFLRPDNPWLLDASPSYSAAPLEGELAEGKVPRRMSGVPQRIAASAPDSRFIYLMRDPVKRAYSAYWHNVRAGNESRPVSEALRAGGTYLRMGCYHYQIQRFLECFDRDQFLLLFFEDFVKHPEQTAGDCIEWLGLEPVADFEVGKGKNESYTYGPLLSRVDSMLANRGGVKRLAKSAKRFVPHNLLQKVRQSMTKAVPPLADTDQSWLANYYAEPNRLLESELGLKHLDWIAGQSR